jgi:hypothetical protein
VKEDFAQCVLFDGSGRTARLNGISCIVSEKLFDTLPAAARAYAEMLSWWRPAFLPSRNRN